MKTCRKCLLSLEDIKFLNRGHRREARCRDCVNKWVKEYRHRIGYSTKFANEYFRNGKSKENFALYIKERNKEFKDKYGFSRMTAYRIGFENMITVLDRDGKICKICKTQVDLTFDHIDGRGRHNLEKGLPMNNNPENLRILCRSCHGRISVLHKLEMKMGARK